MLNQRSGSGRWPGPAGSGVVCNAPIVATGNGPFDVVRHTNTPPQLRVRATVITTLTSNSGPHKGPRGVVQAEADRDAAGRSAAHGSIRSPAPG